MLASHSRYVTFDCRARRSLFSKHVHSKCLNPTLLNLFPGTRLNSGFNRTRIPNHGRNHSHLRSSVVLLKAQVSTHSKTTNPFATSPTATRPATTKIFSAVDTSLIKKSERLCMIKLLPTARECC